jgi:septal ring factor EnvC (AmiA/AmiB activator)
MSTTSVSITPQAKSTQQSSVMELSQLKQRLEQKKSELSATDDEALKSTIRKAIADLEAKIAKTKPAEAQANKTGEVSTESTRTRSELAGESKRIGTNNFDEASEFGERVAYV